jgi:hypothetical protein
MKVESLSSVLNYSKEVISEKKMLADAADLVDVKTDARGRYMEVYDLEENLIAIREPELRLLSVAAYRYYEPYYSSVFNPFVIRVRFSVLGHQEKGKEIVPASCTGELEYEADGELFSQGLELIDE